MSRADLADSPGDIAVPTFEFPTQGIGIDYIRNPSREISSTNVSFCYGGRKGPPRGLVGIVIGQWLRPTVSHFTTTAQPLVTSPGATLRIRYAIALLYQ